MRLIRVLHLRLRSVFLRPRVEQELDDELRDYLEREREAGRAAPRGLQQVQEECRDTRGVRWLEDLLADTRFALRSLRRAPAFTLASVAALALCIGATAAIFSVVDGVLFRPLAFPESERLVFATEGVPSLGFPSIPYSAPDYLFVARENQVYESMAAYENRSYEMSGGGEPLQVRGARATPGLFQTLRVAPIVGRTFTAREDEEAKTVAVLTEGLARSMFGAPEGALGATVHLDRKAYTVIGVLPGHFSFPFRGARFDRGPARVFVPMSWTKNDREEPLNNFNYCVVARLRAGVAVAQARAATLALLGRIASTYPPAVQEIMRQRLPNYKLLGDVTVLQEEVSGSSRRPLLMLLAGVGLVLLIGCADVANLMFSRLIGRRWEFAMRSALGAGRFRLVRQTLTEALVLAVLGGAAGLLLAQSALAALIRYLPDDLPRQGEIALDGRVLAFTAAIVLLTPILFCAAPVVDVLGARLREGGRSLSRSRTQRVVMSGTVAAQYALVFILLCGAGLLARSYWRASKSNPGFKPDQLLTVRVDLPSSYYDKPEAWLSFYDRLLSAVAALPGVRQSSAISDLPMRASSNQVLTMEGGQHATERVDTLYCAGDVLGTLGARLVEGRLLEPADRVAKVRPVVISETLARRAWPGKNAAGRRLKTGVAESEPWSVVVGVVADIRERLTKTEPRSMMFVTTAVQPQDDMNLLVRTTLDPAAMINAVRGEIRKMDARLPAEEGRTLGQVLDESLTPERFRTALLGAFAVSALLLALVGIAGLLAYGAAQRASEFAVRLALGAQRDQLLWTVLRQALGLALAGITGGVAASLAVNRALASLLYGIGQFDPFTYLGVPALLILVTVSASLWPAWRASRTDAVAALRGE